MHQKKTANHLEEAWNYPVDSFMGSTSHDFWRGIFNAQKELGEDLPWKIEQLYIYKLYNIRLCLYLYILTVVSN